jgi:transcriptional regulator with XRE-family HTH domain
MKSNKPARKYNSPVITQFLEETTPAEKLQNSTKMTLAARLDDLITAKGWGKSEFAEIVKKSPSEITKWLSGTQNFTIDTLAEIAVALNMPVAELFASRQVQVVNKVQFMIRADDLQQGIAYITPTTIADRLSNIYSGVLYDSMLSTKSRIPA